MVKSRGRKGREVDSEEETAVERLMKGKTANGHMVSSSSEFVLHLPTFHELLINIWALEAPVIMLIKEES